MMTKVSLLISYPLSKICRRTPQSVLLFEHCFSISYKNKSPCIQLDIIMTNIRRSREQCKRACSIGIAEAPPDMRPCRIYAEAESNANELARLALPRRHRICAMPNIRRSREQCNRAGPFWVRFSMAWALRRLHERKPPSIGLR